MFLIILPPQANSVFHQWSRKIMAATDLTKSNFEDGLYKRSCFLSVGGGVKSSAGFKAAEFSQTSLNVFSCN